MESFPASVAPFSVLHAEPAPFGELAAVRLPEGLGAEVEGLGPGLVASGRLHPEEWRFARGLSGRRQSEWIGGRVALRCAAGRAGRRLGPVLSGPRGEPLLPPGISASVTHKRGMAAALVGAAAHGRLGLDLELMEPARPRIAERILLDAERAAVEALPEPGRWEAILTRFAVKEAIYKGLHPWVGRYVGFDEASVMLAPDGSLACTLLLAGGEGPFEVEARVWRRELRLLAFVRIRQA